MHEEGSERLRRYLKARQVDADLLTTGAVRHVTTAAAALAVGPEAVVKTIVFEGKRHDGVVVAIAPGHRRVDPRKIAAVAGVPPLRLARPDTVKRVTGYDVGGVPPVGHADQVTVVVDPRVLHLPMVFGGGGDDRHMLRIAATDVVRLTGAQVADITSPLEPDDRADA